MILVNSKTSRQSQCMYTCCFRLSWTAHCSNAEETFAFQLTNRGSKRCCIALVACRLNVLCRASSPFVDFSTIQLEGFVHHCNASYFYK